MINTSNKDDFGWGNKIPTTGPSNLTNGPISDHSAVGLNTSLHLANLYLPIGSSRRIIALILSTQYIGYIILNTLHHLRNEYLMVGKEKKIAAKSDPSCIQMKFLLQFQHFCSPLALCRYPLLCQ